MSPFFSMFSFMHKNSFRKILKNKIFERRLKKVKTYFGSKLLHLQGHFFLKLCLQISQAFSESFRNKLNNHDKKTMFKEERLKYIIINFHRQTFPIFSNLRKKKCIQPPGENLFLLSLLLMQVVSNFLFDFKEIFQNSKLSSKFFKS